MAALEITESNDISLERDNEDNPVIKPAAVIKEPSEVNAQDIGQGQIKRKLEYDKDAIYSPDKIREGIRSGALKAVMKDITKYKSSAWITHGQLCVVASNEPLNWYYAPACGDLRYAKKVKTDKIKHHQETQCSICLNLINKTKVKAEAGINELHLGMKCNSLCFIFNCIKRGVFFDREPLK